MGENRIAGSNVYVIFFALLLSHKFVKKKKSNWLSNKSYFFKIKFCFSIFAEYIRQALTHIFK